jgi:hypothetical protein
MRFLDRLTVRLRRTLAPLGLGLAAVVGCYPSGTGANPDDKGLYYPVGISLSPSGRWAFVANSNFDLAYNAGTVQAFDLALIKAKARECRDARRKDPANNCHLGAEEAPFVRASVRVGAFTADLRAVVRKKEGAAVANAGRLLLPIRGDASLTAIDFDETGDSISLKCGSGVAQPNTVGGTCAGGWRLGTDPAKSIRQLVLEGEPFGIAVPDSPTDIAAVVHQSTGNVSLFVDVAADGSPPPGQLTYVLGGLAAGGTSITPFDDVGGHPRFLVTNRTQSNVLIVQYFPDPQKGRSALVLSDVVPIPPQASGYDTRGAVVDPPNPGETRPTRVFLTNRTPAALVIGQIDPATNRLSFYDNVALPVGPSRITRATIDGKTLILVASFDARAVVIYDPDARRISNVLRTHRGPYAMTVDAVNKLGLVANFTDSTVQVIELDPAEAGQPDYQRVIYSVGVPSGPSR